MSTNKDQIASKSKLVTVKPHQLSLIFCIRYECGVAAPVPAAASAEAEVTIFVTTWRYLEQYLR